MAQVLALVLDAGQKRQFNVSTDTLKIANAVNPTDAVAYGQLIDTASGGALIVPITKNDYVNSFVIPDTGALIQPTRSTFALTARTTIAGTGRETVFDPSNNPYSKGAYNQPAMVIRNGEFVQQYSRLIAAGNERATFTEDARLVMFSGLGSSVGADATLKIGVTAVLGTANTFIRSDAAQALDQTIDLAMTVAQTITITDATTATTTDNLTLTHNTSATPNASTFGVELLFKGKSATVSDRSMASVSARWVTTTDASRDGFLSLQAANSSGFPGVSGGITIWANGSLSFGSTKPTITGVASFNAYQIVGAVNSGVGTVSTFLQNDGINGFINSSYTFPTTISGSRKMLMVNSTTAVIATTETWAVPGTLGNVLISDATNWISAKLPPVTIDDYGSVSIPDTANLNQPNRTTLITTERETLAGTGRNTLYDPLNAPIVMYDKGALSPGSFILRDQEFMLQNKRIAVVGNQRATMTDSARFVGFDFPASCSRLVLSGSSQNNN